MYKQSYQSRIGLMNVKDGKFLGKPLIRQRLWTSSKRIEKATRDLHPFEYNFERDNCSSNIPRLLFTDRSNETKDIPLKTLYPKVYSILSKGNNPTTLKWDEKPTKGECLPILSRTRRSSTLIFHFGTALYKVPEQRSGGWDDVLRYHKIPAEFSKDGQEHLANNKKDFSNILKRV